MRPRYWIWVFSGKSPAREVLRSSTMYFSASASARAEQIQAEDFALMYSTRGAYGNPNKDESRIFGEVRVSGSLIHLASGQEIGGRIMNSKCSFEVVALAAFRTGLTFRPHIEKLNFLSGVVAWGQKFRQSPLKISKPDYEYLAGELRKSLTESSDDALVSWVGKRSEVRCFPNSRRDT